jgi:transcriptional antiterminator NusG
VRVIEGPFVNFQGLIDDLNPERGKLKVMVAIFGRMTPVELEYYQVERL